MRTTKAGNSFVQKMEAHEDPDEDLFPDTREALADDEAPTRPAGPNMPESIIAGAGAHGWEVVEVEDGDSSVQFRELDGGPVATFSGDNPEQEAQAYLDGYTYAGHQAIQLVLSEVAQALDKRGIQDCLASVTALKNMLLGRAAC